MEMLDWFEEQIEQRKKKDEELFREAFTDLASVVQGEKVLGKLLLGDMKKTTKTIEQILHFYRLKTDRLQIHADGFNEQLSEYLRPLGMMRRDVKLEEGWYGQTIGALLGFTKDGDPAALLPRRNGYVYFDYNKGKWKKIGKKNCRLFREQAVCFYKPFPAEPSGGGEFVKFCLQVMDSYDYIRLIMAFLLVSLTGLVTPYVTRQIFEQIVPKGDRLMLLAAAVVLAGVSVSGMLFTIVLCQSAGCTDVWVGGQISVDLCGSDGRRGRHDPESLHGASGG